MAVEGPIPSASVATMAIVSAGALTYERTAKRASRQIGSSSMNASVRAEAFAL
jgi:hypothetical protein